MTKPLSESRLNEIRSAQLGEWLAGDWRFQYVEADTDYYRLTTADGTVLAQLPDWAGPVALFIADAHEAVPELLAENGRFRELFAPAELTTWAEQLQSAGLTPHPAFAWCGTTTGYEAAMQVATTDQLTTEAREQLLAELQKAFDETVRRVLGYHPAEGAKVQAKADLGVLVSCYALSCPNGEYSRLAEQRGWTVHSLGMWCCPKHPAAALEAGQ